ncbi:LysR family transcriptional regulator [Paenibacillus sp. NPDC058071]|uniref:LysR family transcriptional regulator n=1 Tax=Paenibacillus sp. NPDC058071 TaxID=3346326 RepID=UPI0036DB95B6
MTKSNSGGDRIEIRQLQTFKAVADWQSFTKAAQSLQYSQASVTSHIQQLEQEIGAPLFDRLGKQIRLTSVGRELYTYGEELLAAYAKIKHLSADDFNLKGELRIGASETITVYKLGPVLSAFKKSYPGVTVSLINDHCPSLREKLHSGELDLAMTLEPVVNDPQLVMEVCSEEPLVFVGEYGHNLTHIEESNGACVIFSEKNCSLRRFYEQYLIDKGMSAAQYLEFTSMEAMKQCVASGLGVSLMPLISVESLLRENKLETIPSPEDDLTFYMQIIVHKNKWLSKAQLKWMELARNEFMRSAVGK